MSNWVHVFDGPIPIAGYYRSVLEANGIPVYERNENLAMLNPIFVDTNPFHVWLMVPESALEEARRLIECSEPE